MPKVLGTFQSRRYWLGALREIVAAAPMPARRRKRLNAALDRRDPRLAGGSRCPDRAESVVAAWDTGDLDSAIRCLADLLEYIDARSAQNKQAGAGCR